uniref:Uncharacterized protein n=1 Tax=Rhizophora mucronata TaxID=61149 RepID=A0A2P2NTB4_RHIMU
MHVAAGVTLVD